MSHSPHSSLLHRRSSPRTKQPVVRLWLQGCDRKNDSRNIISRLGFKLILNSSLSQAGSGNRFINPPQQCFPLCDEVQVQMEPTRVVNMKCLQNSESLPSQVYKNQERELAVVFPNPSAAHYGIFTDYRFSELLVRVDLVRG